MRGGADDNPAKRRTNLCIAQLLHRQTHVDPLALHIDPGEIVLPLGVITSCPRDRLGLEQHLLALEVSLVIGKSHRCGRQHVPGPLQVQLCIDRIRSQHQLAGFDPRAFAAQEVHHNAAGLGPEGRK